MNEFASSLEELVAPLTEEQFLTHLRERKLTLLRGAKGAPYAKLLGWEPVRRLIEGGEHHERDRIRVAKKSAMVSRDHWTTDGKVDTAKLEGFLAKGFSVIITHIEPYIPALATLCADIKSRLSEESYAGVIITTGTGEGAANIHYDPEDLIILQLEGTKRWQIYGPAVPNPVTGEPLKSRPPESAPIFDEVLQPGDLLFLPGGNWHQCENGLSRSVHLGIFFIPPTAWHAMRMLSTQLLSEELFRTPLTRVNNPSELSALQSRIKESLIEKITQLNMNDFLDKWPKKANNPAVETRAVVK